MDYSRLRSTGYWCPKHGWYRGRTGSPECRECPFETQNVYETDDPIVKVREKVRQLRVRAGLTHEKENLCLMRS